VTVWTERIERIRHLRNTRRLDSYEWVEADQLVVGDRFLFGGDWFEVLDVELVDPNGVSTVVSYGELHTVIDYLAFEAVRVRRPRPAGATPDSVA
jgi:hypothetical protein